MAGNSITESIPAAISAAALTGCIAFVATPMDAAVTASALVRDSEHNNSFVEDEVRNEIWESANRQPTYLQVLRDTLYQRSGSWVKRNRFDRTIERSHDGKPETLSPIFVPQHCVIEFLDGFFDEADFYSHLSRASATRCRTIFQSWPSEAPANARRARRSISVPHSDSANVGSSSVAGSRLTRSSAASSARSTSDSASATLRSSSDFVAITQDYPATMTSATCIWRAKSTVSIKLKSPWPPILLRS